MGNAIIFIWGPLFKVLPHPIARSAARTVAGQTRKNDRSGHGLNMGEAQTAAPTTGSVRC